MATSKENEEFKDLIMVKYPLDDAIDWIRENMNPDEVYSGDFLVDYVKSNNTLENIFDNSELEVWALSNGFIKESE